MQGSLPGCTCSGPWPRSYAGQGPPRSRPQVSPGPDGPRQAGHPQFTGPPGPQCARRHLSRGHEGRVGTWRRSAREGSCRSPPSARPGCGRPPSGGPPMTCPATAGPARTPGSSTSSMPVTRLSAHLRATRSDRAAARLPWPRRHRVVPAPARLPGIGRAVTRDQRVADLPGPQADT